MKRTRFILWSYMSLVAAILMVSLVLYLRDATLLLPFFVGATIFSVGVVALDTLGILDQDHQGHGEIGSADAGHSGDGNSLGHAHEIPVDSAASHVGHGEGAGEDVDHQASPGTHLGDHADLASSRGGSTILSALAYLRMVVYFCLGFGPAGWLALAFGADPLTSLLVALPVGVIALFMAQALFRFQHSDTDSSLHSHELLLLPATVTIPLTHTTMGRVRVQAGMNVTEPYALAAEEGAAFGKGDVVRIVQVTDECVYVA
ncbi:MAG: hypothetical protein H3C34_04730 [Caldilineaceae bacterium]|nr:hypothetical protein [Caldilineaceae bacterium]